MPGFFDLDVGEEFPFKSIGELKEEFYQAMRLPPKRVKGVCKLRIAKPSVFVMNPPILYNTLNPLSPDIYVALYRHDQTSKGHGYYVKLECGRSMMVGPHKFELFFQVRAGCHIRLGCYMPEKDFAFHNTSILYDELRKAIIWRRYYASDATNDIAVEMKFTEKTDITL